MSTVEKIGDTLPDLPSLPGLADTDSLNRSGQTVTVYRWRDRNGNWSFGSGPPVGVKVESLTVDPDANLIQGLPREQEGEIKQIPDPQPDSEAESTSLMGYTAEDVSKIMQSAKDARVAMEKRYQ